MLSLRICQELVVVLHVFWQINFNSSLAQIQSGYLAFQIVLDFVTNIQYVIDDFFIDKSGCINHFETLCVFVGWHVLKSISVVKCTIGLCLFSCILVKPCLSTATSSSSFHIFLTPCITLISLKISFPKLGGFSD